jgi:hypothetical protein
MPYDETLHNALDETQQYIFGQIYMCSSDEAQQYALRWHIAHNVHCHLVYKGKPKKLEKMGGRVACALLGI